MQRFRTILLATDFSPPADVALQQAMNIARHVGAELVIAHAHPVTAAQSTIAQTARLHSDAITQVSERSITDAHRQLEQLFERVTGQGVTVSTLLVDSPPSDGISRAARDVGANLIVVGSQGRTGLSRILLGSVAETILRASEVSVLVARNSAGAGGFKRLAVATDFSPLAASAAEAACALAASNATMQLVHCWELPLVYSDYAAALVPVASELVKEANAAGDEWVSRYRNATLDVRFVLLPGSPAHTIVEQLRKDPADLVLLGSHGRRGFERFLLGSVAERVARHAPCSVLVVRDSDPDRWGQDDPGKGDSRR
jgi:nucleotide-binding universal stress UspA family protein